MAFWHKKKKDDAPARLQWMPDASAGIEQALAQAPVPKMLRGRVKRELESAAEGAARAAGRDRVTMEDVMAGMLAKMPANMREQVEQAMQQGPEGLKNLQKRFKGGK